MGYTYEYIDDFMTLPRLNQMAAYWKENPPLHQIVAGYLGFEKSKSTNDTEQNLVSQSDELMGLAGSFGLSSEKPEWLKKEII